MADTAIVDSYSPDMLDTSPRLSVCLDALCELDALARALPRFVPVDEAGQAHLVVRGMVARMLRLTGQLMQGLTENDVSVESLAKVVLLEGETTQG